MKKKAKKVTGEQGPVKSNPARGKATKALKAKPAKGEATDGSASKAEPAETAPAAALAKPEIKKIQGLLKSKTADGASRLDCRCSNRSVRRGPTTRRCSPRG